MKILVTFQPNTKTYEFEGARVRKTIKGALEMNNVEYTTSIVDTFDVMHLISCEDDNKANDAKENNIPLVRIPYQERDNITLDLILSDKYIIG